MKILHQKLISILVLAAFLAGQTNLVPLYAENVPIDLKRAETRSAAVSVTHASSVSAVPAIQQPDSLIPSRILSAPEASPVALTVGSAAAETSVAVEAQSDHVEGELIVRFKDATQSFFDFVKDGIDWTREKIEAGLRVLSEEAKKLANLLTELGTKSIEKLFPNIKPKNPGEALSEAAKALDETYILRFDEAQKSAVEVAGILGASASVVYAETNRLFKLGTGELSDSASATAVSLSPVTVTDTNHDLDLEDLLNRDLSRLWGLEAINVKDAWKQFDTNGNGKFDADETRPGEGVTVAVIDTGIDYNHPDLFDNIWVNAQEISYAVGDQNKDGKISWQDADFNGDGKVTSRDLDGLVKNDAGSVTWESSRQNGKIDSEELALLSNGSDEDLNGFADDILGMDFETTAEGLHAMHSHGTHVAGTVAARGRTENSVVGVAPWTELMQVKVFDNGSDGTTDVKILQGMKYAIDNGAKILNLSLGGYGTWSSYSYSLHQAMADYARSKQVLVVAAAGNSDMNSRDFIPAGVPGVLSVAAVDVNQKKAYFSNHGMSVEIAAPGVDVLSTVPGGTDSYSGTSMASPHVAGAAALLESHHPDYSPEEVEQALRQSAQPYESEEYIGWGILNVNRALHEPISRALSGRIEMPNFATFDKAQLVKVSLSGLKGRKYRLEWGDSGIRPANQTGEEPFTFYAHPPTQWLVLSEGELSSDAFSLAVDPAAIHSSYLSTTALRLVVEDESGNQFQDIRYVYLADSVPPEGKFFVEGHQPYSGSETVHLKLDFQDAASSLARMRFSEDGKNWTEWEVYQSDKIWKVSSGLGLKKVYAQVEDAYRNKTQAELSVELGKPQWIHLEEEWSAVSFYVNDPRTVAEIRKDQGLSGKIVFWKASSLDSSVKVQVAESEKLEAGRVYWIFNDGAVKQSFFLKGLEAVPEINLEQGWNWIGGFEKSVSVDELWPASAQFLTEFYVWSEEKGRKTYTKTLHPGEVYLVYSAKPQTLARVVQSETLNLNTQIQFSLLSNGKRIMKPLGVPSSGLYRINFDAVKVQLGLNGKLEALELPLKGENPGWERLTFTRLAGKEGLFIETAVFCTNSESECSVSTPGATFYQLDYDHDSIHQQNNVASYYQAGALGRMAWSLFDTGELQPLASQYSNPDFFARISSYDITFRDAGVSYDLLQKGDLDTEGWDWSQMKTRTLAEVKKLLKDDLLIRRNDNSNEVIASDGTRFHVQAMSLDTLYLLDAYVRTDLKLTLNDRLSGDIFKDRSFDYSLTFEDIEGIWKERQYRFTLDDNGKFVIQQIKENDLATKAVYQLPLGEGMTIRYQGERLQGSPVFELDFQGQIYRSDMNGEVLLPYGWSLKPVWAKGALASIQIWQATDRYNSRQTLYFATDPDGTYRITEITKGYWEDKKIIFNKQELSVEETLGANSTAFFQSQLDWTPTFQEDGFYRNYTGQPLVIFEKENKISSITLGGNLTLLRQGDPDFTLEMVMAIPLLQRNPEAIVKLVKDDLLIPITSEGMQVPSSDGWTYKIEKASVEGIRFSGSSKQGEEMLLNARSEISAEGKVLLKIVEWPRQNDDLKGSDLLFKTYELMSKAGQPLYLELLGSEKVKVLDQYAVHFAEGFQVTTFSNGYSVLQSQEWFKEFGQLLAPGQITQRLHQEEEGGFFSCAGFCAPFFSLEFAPDGTLQNLTNWESARESENYTRIFFEKDPARGGFRIQQVELMQNKKDSRRFFNYDELSVRWEVQVSLFLKAEELDRQYKMTSRALAWTFPIPFLEIIDSPRFSAMVSQDSIKYILDPVGKPDISSQTDWSSFKDRTLDGLKEFLRDDVLLRVMGDWVMPVGDAQNRFRISWSAYSSMVFLHQENRDGTSNWSIPWEKTLNGEKQLRVPFENGRENRYRVIVDSKGEISLELLGVDLQPPVEESLFLGDQLVFQRFEDGARLLNFNQTLYPVSADGSVDLPNGCRLQSVWEKDRLVHLSIYLANGERQELELVRDPTGKDQERVVIAFTRFTADGSLISSTAIDYARGVRETTTFQTGHTETEVIFALYSEFAYYFLYFTPTDGVRLEEFSVWAILMSYTKTENEVLQIKFSNGDPFEPQEMGLLEKEGALDFDLEQILNLKSQNKTLEHIRSLLNNDVLITLGKSVDVPQSSLKLQIHEVFLNEVVFEDEQTHERYTATSLNNVLTLNLPGNDGGFQTYEVIPDTKTSSVKLKLKKETNPSGIQNFFIYEGESIQTVIDGVQSGDHVVLGAGTYKESLVLKTGVSLQGAVGEEVLIQGDNKAGTSIITAQGNNRIEGITVTGGGAYNGSPASAVKIDGPDVTISNVTVKDNQGYGICVNTDGAVTIENSTFENNHIAVQLPKDKTVIRDSVFNQNDIAVNVLMGKSPVIEKNRFTNNRRNSIYEFIWGRTPTRGLAVVQNNYFCSNEEKPSYYGTALPPAVENRTGGNTYC